MFEEILIIYGILSLSHLIVQSSIAHFHHIKSRKNKYKVCYLKPRVSVIIPSYNEEAKWLADCIDSLLKQKYDGGIEVLVIDDGSKNRTELMPVYSKYAKKIGVRVIINEKNQGKRRVQKQGFDISTGDIIITVDSDTTIEAPYGIANIVKNFKDETIGAVTGEVRVLDTCKNLLTKLIDFRYWMAFNQERAAQSNFNVVMCCSGPFAAYRKFLIDRIKDKYISQYFLGEKCTYGDDRHLTNLILEEGYSVRYDEHSKAMTHVPDNLRTYIKQQIRWNKSFYREFLWTIRFVHRHHFYMIYDLTIQTLLPFLLVLAILVTITQFLITQNAALLIFYFLVLISIANIRSAYGFYRTGDIQYLIFPIYAFLHILVLVPIRFWSIFTLKSTRWGTR